MTCNSGGFGTIELQYTYKILISSKENQERTIVGYFLIYHLIEEEKSFHLIYNKTIKG